MLRYLLFLFLGIIGDWKNHFTMAENEAFDKLFAEKMTGSKLKFRFEPSLTQRDISPDVL